MKSIEVVQSQSNLVDAVAMGHALETYPVFLSVGEKH